ncbi:MAG: hypothetical protein U0T33_00300 [Bacteroidales bacterium]
MERTASLKTAKFIMGKNFIGHDQLAYISERFGINRRILENMKIPELKFPESILKENADDYILILGIQQTDTGRPLTINYMRSTFGVSPAISEPCFYNQDWYLNEDFASKFQPENKWYLLKKTVAENSRGVLPDTYTGLSTGEVDLPSAVLCAFAFFAYYLVSGGEKLWADDFVWTSDCDRFGDQIYVGRYFDRLDPSRCGFNVHRHLKIKSNYGIINSIS